MLLLIWAAGQNILRHRVGDVDVVVLLSLALWAILLLITWGIFFLDHLHLLDLRLVLLNQRLVELLLELLDLLDFLNLL